MVKIFVAINDLNRRYIVSQSKIAKSSYVHITRRLYIHFLFSLVHRISGLTTNPYFLQQMAQRK